MKKNILIFMAAALLCVGLTACGGEKKLNNPLNIEAPVWQQFAHPKGENVIIYKNADTNSSRLQFAAEPCDGDACDFKILWSDEKAPSGWSVDDETANNYSAYPILGEEGDFYKVYVSREWLGAVEGYIKKAECDVIKPVELTPALVDSIGKTECRRDYIISEGKLENLCLSSYLGEYDGMEFELGQFCGNCLVFVETKPVMINASTENEPIIYTQSVNEGNEEFVLNCGQNQLFQSTEGNYVLDTKKLSDDQVLSLFESTRMKSTEMKEVLFYLPDVNKECFQHFYIYLTGIELIQARLRAVENLSNPSDITSTSGCPFNVGDALGYWTYKSGGESLVFIIYRKGQQYFDVDFDAYNKSFRAPHPLRKGTTHGMEVFRCDEERYYYQIKTEGGGLAIRDIGDPDFVVDSMSPMEWK